MGHRLDANAKDRINQIYPINYIVYRQKGEKDEF